MALSGNLSSVDMNDDFNLDLYSQLLLFKNDSFQDEVLWSNPDNRMQRTLQSLAHKLDLEYEYSLHTQAARISRTTVPELHMGLEPRELDLIDMRFLENDESIPSVNFSVSNSLFHDVNWSTSFRQPDPRASTPIAPEPLPDLSKWPTLVSNDFLQGADAGIFSTASEAQPLKLSADNILPEHYVSERWSQPQSLVSFAMETNHSSFRPQPNWDSLLNIPPNEYELQSGPQQTLDLPARPSDSVSFATVTNNGPADTDLDMDDSEASVNPLKHQRFHCSGYPPCTLSFTRSEHLARHIRKHTHDRHFQCHCGRRFIRLDNLRLHAQTAHGTRNEEIIADSLLATGARLIKRQIRSDGVRTPAHINNVNLDVSSLNIRESRRNSAPNTSETWGSSPKQPANRSRSVSSFQSDRGPNGLKDIFSRRSSAHSWLSAGYQEIVFDSKSVNSESQASSVSGRQGPLDGVAIAAMNAVKRIGACWRCKFLRKSCSAETPCDLCPKGHGRSNWGIVGCKRGNLKIKMPPIIFCPNWALPQVDFSEVEAVAYDVGRQPENESLQRHIERREKELRDIDSESNTQIHTSVLTPGGSPLGLTVTLYSSIRAPKSSPPALIPLNECILAIAWEFNDQSSAYNALEVLGNRPLESFMALLRSAAIYQVKLESDQLIAQSLICLRSCLEAINVKDSIGLFQHRYCHKDSCKVQCISNLDLNISLYIDELSRVFFRKENLKNRDNYWISAFYSFCIQAVVRRILQKLVSESNVSPSLDSGSKSPFSASPLSASPLSASKQFLHLAVNLFIASSGTYDPLITTYRAVEPESVLEHEDIFLLQQALGGPVQSSADYLRKLFEIEEEIKR